jgi:conjugative relaxase-like TrwC/TraI family protein
MLSPKTQTNLKNAKGYFEEHLSVGDYYAEGARVRGEWLGEGAALLGLSGPVGRDEFLALCENQVPGSGERLTQRQKGVRRSRSSEDAEEANRRVFYDFTFSPPKSVSIAALVTPDERIVAAHGAAVKVALRELERFAAARIRAAGESADRRTGNIVAALFEHDTSRALDPLRHTHCIVFNATHDAEEGRWKALQNYDMLAAQKFAENVYYHELARALRGFGYTVVNSARGDFELAEIAPELRERFSKRHREIDEKTRAFLAAHPEKRLGNESAIREHIAHKERAQKARNATMETLRGLWDSQLTAGERKSLKQAEARTVPVVDELTAADAVTWAEEHLFERRAVVREHELWRYALAAARGAKLSVRHIQDETAARKYVRSEGDKVGDPEALAREWALVEAARDGIGRHAPLAPPTELDPQASPEQCDALKHILSSTSFMTLFRGGAGTGKSFVLQRVQRALDQAGRSSVVLAPQRQQVLDLSRDGLHGAQTVSECLQHAQLPRGAVVIVDEAGQIGGRQLSELVRLVQEHGGRLILSGDTRQHGPVEASDALRAIERYSGMTAAELTEIRRQDPRHAKDEVEGEQIVAYRKAVEAAAAGDCQRSFERLDQIGAVVECTGGEHLQQLSETYVRHVGAGESVVVVSQTRAEVRALNHSIRERLRHAGRVAGDEVEFIAFEQIDLTAAQKRDSRFYPPGSILVFNQDLCGCARGEHGRLIGFSPSGAVLEVAGRVHRVQFGHFDRFTVCRAEALTLCAGDRLQLKANGEAVDGRKLANGEIVTVAGLEDGGAIRLDDGRTLPISYRRFQRGYAVTSYGSQGKTVDHVLLGDSAVRAATNAQQWYVSISRGRKSVRIFTPDREHLRQAIQRVADRELALDLVGSRELSGGIRNQLVHGLSRGKELAKRICRAAMCTWAAKYLSREHISQNDTTSRTEQARRTDASNMLAT